jgi:hypothetical protein
MFFRGFLGAPAYIRTTPEQPHFTFRGYFLEQDFPESMFFADFQGLQL